MVKTMVASCSPTHEEFKNVRLSFQYSQKIWALVCLSLDEQFANFLSGFHWS